MDAGYRYLPDVDLHALDCGGRLTLELGLGRLRALEHELAKRSPCDGVRKLLIDFRATSFDSEETHRALSTATRSALGLDRERAAVRVAFVHPSGHGVVSGSEAWFCSETEAMAWLARD